MSTGAIPFTEIEAYARIHRVYNMENFAYLISRLDEIWLQEKDNAGNNANRKN